jgi:transposase-like protein
MGRNKNKEKDQRRRRWSFSEKSALVRRTYEPGMSVSLVARQEGVSAGLLFQWRKLERQGALTAVSAGEAVVPASELAAARAEIAKLQRVLGKKTLENEILKEAVEYATEKKWIARSPDATSVRLRPVTWSTGVSTPLAQTSCGWRT